MKSPRHGDNENTMMLPCHSVEQVSKVKDGFSLYFDFKV